MVELDLLDRKIMYELDQNARISASQLARRLKKNKETVNFRLNRLIDRGFVKRFYTVFNTSRLGWSYAKFYIKFKNITPEKEEELYQYVLKQPHIAYLASVEGPYDCLLLVMIKSPVDMVHFQDSFMRNYGEYIQEKSLVTFLTTHRFNMRFLYEGKEKADWYYPMEIGDYKIDETDEKIMFLLSKDARMPLTEMAKRLGIDHKVVKYRMNKLEDDGIILAYVTSPDFDKLGFTFYQVNIQLKDPTVRREIIEFFNMTNKCLFAMELLGKYDVLVELHVRNSDEMKSIINDFRKRYVDKYNDYDVSTIMKEYTMVWSPFSID